MLFIFISYVIFLPLLISDFLMTFLYFFFCLLYLLFQTSKGFLGNEMLAISGMVLCQNIFLKKPVYILTAFLLAFIASCSFPVIHIDHFCHFLNIYVLIRKSFFCICWAHNNLPLVLCSPFASCSVLLRGMHGYMPLGIGISVFTHVRGRTIGYLACSYWKYWVLCLECLVPSEKIARGQILYFLFLDLKLSEYQFSICQSVLGVYIAVDNALCILSPSVCYQILTKSVVSF